MYVPSLLGFIPQENKVLVNTEQAAIGGRGSESMMSGYILPVTGAQRLSAGKLFRGRAARHGGGM